MPGKKHEDMVEFVVKDVRSILRFLEIEVPDDVTAAAHRGLDVSEAIPKQLLADGRIVIGKPPVLGLVIEVQSSMDAKTLKEKQFKWPHYAMGLRTELGCPTDTLVITTNSRIERLAREPIQIGQNLWWRAIVLGPSNLPKKPSADFTRDNPTLAILALMAHGRRYTSPGPPAQTLKGLWESDLFQRLENKDQRTYYDLALHSLPLWIAQALQEDPMTQQYYSPVVLNYVEQGREEGREAGIEAGLRRSIFLLLDARGYVPTEADLQRIENEHDKSALEAIVKSAANLAPDTPLFDDH